ncbi:MAG: murein biosynthesis integral membrane protein MurJ [Pseudomonadota bacterium]
MTARPIRLLAGFATVGSWTMASRVFGFLRDMMIAALLGAGPAAEAFFVAFRLPNMFRRFFAEGAFNIAFVPLFARRLEAEGEAEAKRFAEEALAILLTALIVLTVAAQAAMPWVVWALASGLEEETFDLAVTFSRICFPYILFISLTALLSGMLNAFGRFAAAAAAPVLLNVILLGAMAIGAWLGWSMGPVLAWSALIAGVAQLALVAFAAAQAGLTLRLRLPQITPGVRRLIALGIPGVLAGGVMQINLVVGTQVASYFEGAVVWLWLADRVYQLPLGVVGVAIGVVLLPELSRRFRREDRAGANDAMNRAAEFALVLALPATIALIAMPELITAALYERGAFDAVDTQATALALMIYALGLPAFVLLKIVQPAFFAREDTRTPLRYAVWAMAINLIVAIAGAPFIGWAAAAVGTTLAAWVNFAMTWRGALGLGEGIAADQRLRSRAPKILVSAVLMGGVVAATAALTQSLGPTWRLPGLALAVAAGLGSFGVLGLATGAFHVKDLRAAMRRS